MSWIKDKWQGLLNRMVREKAPPEFTARGWAIGMFYGCTIPFGFQLLLSIPTAMIMKGSKVGATLGTLFTNHFTIFIIYPIQCWLGNRLMGGDLSWAAIEGAMRDVVQERSWQSVLQLTGGLMESFFLGGLVLAAVLVPLTYYGVLRYVRAHRARRQGRRARRQAARQAAARNRDVPA